MLRERSAIPDISPKIRSPATRVVRLATKAGFHDGAFVWRSIGDFGIPVFHRTGWRWRPKAASLTRGSEGSGVRGDRMLIQPAREGVEYEVKRQANWDVRASSKHRFVSQRQNFHTPRTKSRRSQASRLRNLFRARWPPGPRA